MLRKLGQEELAARSGVAVATIRRFEKTGIASIENILRVAVALRAEEAFDKLFEAPTYASLDEALARPEPHLRQRAPRRR